MSTVDTAVSAIDAAIGDSAGITGGCCKCGRSLADSPSDDFCSESCQTQWRAEHVTVLPGHDVLDQVQRFVSRFNIFPSEHCAPMLALWYAHTHAADHFYVTPRLILSSVEPGSGKTRVLEVAQFLVRAPEMTISATTAALFRMSTTDRSRSCSTKSTPSSAPRAVATTKTYAVCSTPGTSAPRPLPAVSATPKP
jgi:hypothetical protein